MNNTENKYAPIMKNGYKFYNLREVLKIADEHEFGVVACNVRGVSIMRAILTAAFESKSPVILEIAESETGYANMAPARLSKLAVGFTNEMIEKYGYTVPICLHHDHIQKDVDGCVLRSIEAGFSSIEVDLSKLPLKENIAKCKEVAEKIRPYGIGLEVEDGEIGNAAALADPDAAENMEKYFSKVEDCVRLCEAVRPDAIAFFVGNGHGNYLSKPIIGFERIKDICDAVRYLNVFGVMHGGSGLSIETFNKCIEAGARKFNYGTAISNIWFEYFDDELIKRMQVKADELGKTIRKVLYLFEEELLAIDFAEAEKAMVEHISLMMKEAFLSAGKAELYV